MTERATCPCGSGFGLLTCCGPFLAGLGEPPTAEALMRARYTAFTRGDGAFLARTQASPEDPEVLAAFGRRVTWLGLTVYRRVAGGPEDATGEIWFLARLAEDGRPGRIHEASRFARQDGRWIYLAGQTPAVGRNAPCVCGSGVKFKRCCGA